MKEFPIINEFDYLKVAEIIILWIVLIDKITFLAYFEQTVYISSGFYEITWDLFFLNSYIVRLPQKTKGKYIIFFLVNGHMEKFKVVNNNLIGSTIFPCFSLETQSRYCVKKRDKIVLEISITQTTKKLRRKEPFK